MKRSAGLILIGVPLLGIVAFIWQRSQRSDLAAASQAELVAKLQAENRDLRQKLDQMHTQGAAAPSEPVAPGVARDASSHRRSGTQPGQQPPATDQAATISWLRDSLSAAQANIDELNSRTADLQTRLDRAKAAEDRLSAAESALTGQLASMKQQAETTAAELGRQTAQLSQTEAANKKLREEASGAGSKAAQVLKTTKELQDLYRRREQYLQTLVSRYRDLTEQYRSLASILDNRRGPEGTPGGGAANAGPEVARIQSTVGMAEEDLRQLNALNAQVQQIQKKLASQ